MPLSKVQSNSILDGDVTAADLHTTAVTDKLGYTPVNKAGDTINGNLVINGNIRNAAGIKTYSVTTGGQGNQGIRYEVARISRDVVNWSEEIGLDITVYSRYYYGGVARWYITYNQLNSGTVVMSDSNGQFRHKLYLGSEVTVAGNIRYRPIFIDIPPYQQVSIEVKYTTTEVSTITGASQIQFTGTVTNASVTNLTSLYNIESPQGIRTGRTVYNWFQWGGNPGSAYLHIKTTLWGGGSPNGNSQPTMTMVHVKGYTYDAHTIDGMIGFHNWTGGMYSLRVSNAGSHPGAHGAYVSSDGYVVLVFNTSANYPGISIDYHQSYPYTYQDVQILAYQSSASTSGVY